MMLMPFEVSRVAYIACVIGMTWGLCLGLLIAALSVTRKRDAFKARVQVLEGILKALIEKDVHTVECNYAVIGGVGCNCGVPAIISDAINPQPKKENNNET